MILLPIIRRNLSLLHPKNAAFFSLVHFSSSSSSSSSASETLNPSPNSNPIVEYLINSCGLSSQKAANASKLIPKSSTIDQAESVRLFFKHHGFTDSSIRKLVSNYPRILCADVEKTLKPKLESFCEMGFATAELESLVTSNAGVLLNPLAIPRLDFWQKFLGTDNKRDLVFVFAKNSNLIEHNIESGIAPKIALLKEHGLSEMDIVKIMRRSRFFIKRSLTAIEELLNNTKKYGFDPASPMFGQGLRVLHSTCSHGLKSKMEFFKGFGWSEVEFLAAFKKAPHFIKLSEENIRGKMEFLVGRAGCEQSYIALNPLLLMFSLEKRLKPRHYVIEVLKSHGIVGRARLYRVMCYPEDKFVENVILPYKEQVPDIQEIYVAACAGQIPA